MIEERAPISDKWLFQEKFWINRLRKKPQQFQNITAEVSKRYFAYEMLNEDPFENSTDIFLEICKIRLRYIDMKLDFNFFTDCAKILSMGDETTSTRIGAIKDLAKKVVRHKNMRHSEGEYVLNEFRQPFPSKDDDEIIQDAEELSEYNKVLSSILGNAQWDLL